MGDLSDFPDLRERCFILDGLITFSLVIGDEDAILFESEPSCSYTISTSLVYVSI